MGDRSNIRCAFGFNSDISHQHPAAGCFENRNLRSTASCGPSTIVPPENACSRKRHFDQPDFSGEMCVPHKRPASEEAISRGLSNLNISPPSVKYGEVEMVSIENSSDESDDECVDERGSIVLPEELRRGYQRLGTDGGIPDAYLQKILTPKACLALVPYIPRPPLPLILASDPPMNNSVEDNDVTEAKTVEFEPMECILTNQASELRPSSSTFDSPLSLSTPSQASYTYE